jgi:glycosyltransferase involved in cell wall biosynthesis
MKTPPKVSVIVPNYNYGRFLPRCLDSILSQTYRNLEVFVIDGASTDNSMDIIEAYARNTPFLRFLTEKDEGPADAINKGIRLTTGTYATWLNSDDALDPQTIERAVLEFERNDHLSLVYGSVLNTTDTGTITELNRGLTLKASDLTVFDFIPQTGTVFKRYADLQLDKTLEWGFDWDLWIELAKRGDILNINHIVGYCIVTGNAKRKSDMIIPRRTLELARIARKHSQGLNVRVILAYLAAALGYGCMPLRFVDANYHKRIVRWVGRLNRVICNRADKGIML